VEDRVMDFFPEYLPAEPCENMRKMRLKHLLTMSTGHLEEPRVIGLNTPEDWCKQFMQSYVPEEPGTRFVYNTAATYMLSAVIQKVTGQTTYDYLQPRLFEPLGISGIWWDTCPKGISAGGFGLNVHTEDIAKFGQLYLQKGMWEGKQLLDPAWVETATSKLIDNYGVGQDWRSGYGYQFWQCAREGAFRGDGAGGQLCIVVPQKDLVFACTSRVNCTFQDLMDIIFEEIIEPLEDGVVEETVQEAADVCQRIASLHMAMPTGQWCTAKGAAVSGKRYVFGDNALGIRSVSFEFGSERRMTLEIAQGTATLPIGSDQWLYGETAAPAQGDTCALFYKEAALCGAWEDGVFHMRIVYPCTLVGDEWFLRFNDRTVDLTIRRAGCSRSGTYSLIGREA